MIALAVGTLALLPAARAAAAPPQLDSPAEGAIFLANGNPITFQAQTTSGASTASMDFFITRSPSLVNGFGIFSPFVDHIQGVATATPGIFVGSTDSDDAWPVRPDTYWWQAVQDCTALSAPDCIEASGARMLIISPLPASAVISANQIETFWKRHPSHRVRRRKAKFGFKSNVAGAKFRCLFAQGWADCTSPHVFRNLKPGRYTFKVRAVVNGLEDPTPLSWTFRVLRPLTGQQAQSNARR